MGKVADFSVSLSLFFGIVCPYVGASLLRVQGKSAWSMVVRFFSPLIFSQFLWQSCPLHSLQQQLIYDKGQSPFLYQLPFSEGIIKVVLRVGFSLLSDSVYFVSQGNFKSLTLLSTLSLPSSSVFEAVCFRLALVLTF